MKVLQVHNKYSKVGGEESVVEEERNVLVSNGHEVTQFIKESSELQNYSLSQKLKLSISQRNSKQSASEFQKILKNTRPDVCHVHNVFPLITPVVYEICKRFEVPVVQSIHNYKLVCSNGILFRNGRACQECVGRSLIGSIKHKCYRDSYIATAIQSDTTMYHRNKGTWTNSVDRYLALTDFQKQIIVKSGISPEKIIVKANFVMKPQLTSSLGSYFLYFGRLENQKGLEDLLIIIERNPKLKFVLIGDCETPEIFEKFENVNYKGPLDRDCVLEFISKCKAVLFPSKLFEGMPMTILEAFSFKKTVIARNTGAMKSMIQHGTNGLLFDSVDEFNIHLNELDNNDQLLNELSHGAFYDYNEKYTPEIGFKNLMNVYSSVIVD